MITLDRRPSDSLDTPTRPAPGSAWRRGRGLLDRLPPGWPLTAVFTLFPLWWVLGVSNFVHIASAAVMLIELAARRRIMLPRGFVLWAMFLVWVVAGVVLLQVAAPGADPAHSSGRYATWAYRVTWYVACTVAMIYVGNMRRELSLKRLFRAFAVMFLVVAAGGWLGVIAPRLQFPSLLEIVLPKGISGIEFVKFLIHPEVVQLEQGAVTQTPRPSAPFAYSNIWGLNFACFLPFFLAAWFGPTAGWRRRWAPFVLALALVPAVQSLNRGLWAALIVLVVLLAVKLASMNRLKLVTAVAAALVVGGVVVVATPVHQMVQTRLSNPTSNEVRGNLGAATLSSVAAGAPLVGFGSTRDVQGTFKSLAGGDTANCPDCAPPALGTQGQLWLVAFSQGYLGLLLYLSFFLWHAVRGVRLRSVWAMAALGVLAAHAVTFAIYDTINIALFPIFVAVAVIWRERDAALARGRESRVVTTMTGSLTGLIGTVRRNLVLVVACTVGGAFTGIGFTLLAGQTSEASIAVLLPPEPSYLAVSGPPATLDTEAQAVTSASSLDAVAKVVGHSVSSDDIAVTAMTNTRVLVIGLSGRGTDEVTQGVAVAAEQLIAQRKRSLEDRRDSAITSLRSEYEELQKSVEVFDEGKQVLDQRGGESSAEYAFLLENRSRVLAQAGLASARIDRAQSIPLDTARIVRPASAVVRYDGALIAATSGLLIGMLAGVMIALARATIGSSLRRRSTQNALPVPVIAHVDAAGLRPSGALEQGRAGWTAWDETVLAATANQAQAAIASGDSVLVRRVASDLDEDLVSAAGGRGAADQLASGLQHERVVLVCSRKDRVGRVRALIESLQVVGHRVVGVVVT